MLEHVCVKFHFLMCVYDWRVCFCRRHWKWLSPYVICTNYRCLVRFKSISMHNNLVKNTEWTQLETNPQSGSKSWYIMYALVIFVCLVYIYFFSSYRYFKSSHPLGLHTQDSLCFRTFNVNTELPRFSLYLVNCRSIKTIGLFFFFSGCYLIRPFLWRNWYKLGV